MTFTTWMVTSALAVTATRYSALASKSGLVPSARLTSPVLGSMVKLAASGPARAYLTVLPAAVACMGVPTGEPPGEFSLTIACGTGSLACTRWSCPGTSSAASTVIAATASDAAIAPVILFLDLLLCVALPWRRAPSVAAAAATTAATAGHSALALLCVRMVHSPRVWRMDLM